MVVGTIEELRTQSRELAQSAEARQRWIKCVQEGNDTVLRESSQVWKDAITDRLSNSGIDEEGKILEASAVELQDDNLTRAVMCARIIRNAVAGSSEGQVACFCIVPSAIDTLWRTTSFAYEKDEQVHVLSRTLVQLLSNLITQNDELQNRFWLEILSLESKDDKVQPQAMRSGSDLFVRLLQSSDSATSAAAQVLLLNCTLSSEERSRSIAVSLYGCRIINSMLDTIQKQLDDDEREEEDDEEVLQQQALLDTDSAIDVPLGRHQVELQLQRKRYESLGIMYAFFTNLFDRQLFGHLFVGLVVKDEQDALTPLITSSQVTLLKLLDSYLHFGGATYGNGRESSNLESAAVGLKQLIVTFEELSAWAEKVMTGALREGTKANVDTRLVDVHIGLILLLQCLITLGLITERSKDRGNGLILLAAEEVLSLMRDSSFVKKVICEYMRIGQRSERRLTFASSSSCKALLHILSEFSPPVSPFQPTGTSSSQTPSAPTGHSLSSTGLAAQSNTASREGPSLDNLKRDLVDLVGVLCFERSPADKEQVKEVQDTVRACGGIFDVMNMTQLDERNPYIRERAIFTLRNLLRNNQESQDLVAQLKPMA